MKRFANYHDPDGITRIPTDEFKVYEAEVERLRRARLEALRSLSLPDQATAIRLAKNALRALDD